MKYDINQAIDASDYDYRGNQKQAADTVNAKKILVTADVRGRLPQYLRKQIADAGYRFVKIGYTTYVKNVFALY